MDTATRLPSLPFHQREFRRAGLHSATLDVEHEHERPFFTDQPYRFGFAHLTFYRHPSSAPAREEVLTIRFQRNVLGRSNAPTADNISHPRFDYGPHAWSPFYGPRLILPSISLDAAPKLRQVIRAASVLNALIRDPALGAASQATPRIQCDLALHLLALESQGIPVEVCHLAKGGRWSDGEVRSQPDRFQAGTAARLLGLLTGAPTQVAS